MEAIPDRQRPVMTGPLPNGSLARRDEAVWPDAATPAIRQDGGAGGRRAYAHLPSSSAHDAPALSAHPVVHRAQHSAGRYGSESGK
jgi:hypothetical protein